MPLIYGQKGNIEVLKISVYLLFFSILAYLTLVTYLFYLFGLWLLYYFVKFLQLTNKYTQK